MVLLYKLNKGSFWVEAVHGALGWVSRYCLWANK